MRTFYISSILICLSGWMQSQPNASPAFRQPQVEFGQTGLDLSLNKVRLLHHLLPHLDGSQLVLSIKEDAFDTTDIDFKGRWLLAEFASPAIQIHASAMATIAAGAGNSDPTGRGVARGALLSSSDFANLLPDEDSYFLSQNISVQNHSYGTGIENFYGIEAKAYDEQCHRLPALLHVFSAGNQGGQPSQSGTYAGIGGFANLTGQFKQSKNSLTVGACDSLGQVVPLSSRGPAFDGRIKPELVAYGHGGSSGAAALVSGIALVVQQAYLEKKGELPLSELVRAVMVNSANDIGRPQVDFETGFGSADALAAVQTVLDGNYLLGEISQGEAKNIGMNLTQGVGILKITLAWNDPPAAENTGKSLVNDLDLEVQHSPFSEPTLPWVLNTSPHPDSLRQEAQRGRDTLNNIEQVSFFFVVTDVPPQVFVKGSKVSGNQNFALAWQFDTLKPVQWVFPSGSDYLLPGKQNLLRWESDWSPGTTDLSYRFLPDTSWHLIENEVNLSTNSFLWATPDHAGLAQLRFKLNGFYSYLSDTFAISDPLRPKVGFNCPDSLLFFWKPTPDATDYQIFQLGDRYLEPLATTTDTQFIADAATKQATTHFAVAPRFDGKTGARSYAFDYTKQGVGCYLKTFYLQQVLGYTATFRVEIGSTHGLQAVIFEKEQDGEFLPMQTVSPVQSLSLTFEDAALRQGINRYRVRFSLENGGDALSQIEVVYFLEAASCLIFPNPAVPGKPIFLLTKEAADARLKLLDAQGKMIFQGAIEGELTMLPGIDLASGLYFIEVWNEEKRWSGRLVVGK